MADAALISNSDGFKTYRAVCSTHIYRKCTGGSNPHSRVSVGGDVSRKYIPDIVRTPHTAVIYTTQSGCTSHLICMQAAFGQDCVKQKSVALPTEINNGTVAAIDVKHCMHPLSIEECDVYSNLTSTPHATVVVMPNHHMNNMGNVEGFKFTCPGSSSAAVLPIGREMFFRHSAVECIIPMDPNEHDGENIEVLQMIINRADVLQKLTTLVQLIIVLSRKNPATFDCMPENMDMVHGAPHSCYTTSMTADGRDWMPEAPLMVGVYHAYVKTFNNDMRTHKMYIVCSGGCSKISDRYYNLYTDAKNTVTCEDFLNSEESWYLKVCILCWIFSL